VDNPFLQPDDWRWFRANFHTHTAESDGQTPLDQRIRQYRDAGYDILAITDHGRVVDVAGRSTDEFLLINGIEEGVEAFRDGHRFHILCLGLSPEFVFDKTLGPNSIFAQVNAAGGIAFLAHPYWSGVNVNDLLALEGCAGIEVWNSSQWGGGHSVSSVHWDIGLDAGLRFPAIAVDDTHSGPEGDWDLCAGWTMLRMPELSLDAVLNALRAGRFYASTGPVIHDFRVEGDVAYARFSAAREAVFLSWKACGKRVWDRAGGLITEGEMPIRDREWWRYVRLEVTDADGHTAWANPIFLTDE